MSAIAERVAAGAAFLDQHDPDWWQSIDLKRLNVGSCEDCILGQRQGDYADGVQWVWSKRLAADTVDLGFMFSGVRFDVRPGDDADDLTAEWKRVIEQRRAAT